MTLTLPMTIDGEEVEVRADYSFYPSHRGQRDSCGVPMEPDELAHVEVYRYESNGKDVEGRLSEKQVEAIEEACLEREAE